MLPKRRALTGDTVNRSIQVLSGSENERYCEVLMRSRREFLGALPVGILGSCAVANLQAQSQPTSGQQSLNLSPFVAVHHPLDEVTIHGQGQGQLLVLDGDGKPYFDANVTLD